MFGDDVDAAYDAIVERMQPALDRLAARAPLAGAWMSPN